MDGVYLVVGDQLVDHNGDPRQQVVVKGGPDIPGLAYYSISDN